MSWRDLSSTSLDVINIVLCYQFQISTSKRYVNPRVLNEIKISHIVQNWYQAGLFDDKFLCGLRVILQICLLITLNYC